MTQCTFTVINGPSTKPWGGRSGGRRGGGGSITQVDTCTDRLPTTAVTEGSQRRANGNSLPMAVTGVSLQWVSPVHIAAGARATRCGRCSLTMGTSTPLPSRDCCKTWAKQPHSRLSSKKKVGQTVSSTRQTWPRLLGNADAAPFAALSVTLSSILARTTGYPPSCDPPPTARGQPTASSGTPPRSPDPPSLRGSRIPGGNVENR